MTMSSINNNNNNCNHGVDDSICRLLLKGVTIAAIDDSTSEFQIFAPNKSSMNKALEIIEKILGAEVWLEQMFSKITLL